MTNPRTVPSTVNSWFGIPRLWEVWSPTSHTTIQQESQSWSQNMTVYQILTGGNEGEEENFRPYIVDYSGLEFFESEPTPEEGIWRNHAGSGLSQRPSGIPRNVGVIKESPTSERVEPSLYTFTRSYRPPDSDDGKFCLKEAALRSHDSRFFALAVNSLSFSESITSNELDLIHATFPTLSMFHPFGNNQFMVLLCNRQSGGIFFQS